MNNNIVVTIYNIKTGRIGAEITKGNGQKIEIFLDEYFVNGLYGSDRYYVDTEAKMVKKKTESMISPDKIKIKSKDSEQEEFMTVTGVPEYTDVFINCPGVYNELREAEKGIFKFSSDKKGVYEIDFDSPRCLNKKIILSIY